MYFSVNFKLMSDLMRTNKQTMIMLKSLAYSWLCIWVHIVFLTFIYLCRSLCVGRTIPSPFLYLSRHSNLNRITRRWTRTGAQAYQTYCQQSGTMMRRWFVCYERIVGLVYGKGSVQSVKLKCLNICSCWWQKWKNGNPRIVKKKWFSSTGTDDHHATTRRWHSVLVKI